jgi:hypothetical protein
MFKVAALVAPSLRPSTSSGATAALGRIITAGFIRAIPPIVEIQILSASHRDYLYIKTVTRRRRHARTRMSKDFAISLSLPARAENSAARGSLLRHASATCRE